MSKDTVTQHPGTFVSGAPAVLLRCGGSVRVISALQPVTTGYLLRAVAACGRVCLHDNPLHSDPVMTWVAGGNCLTVSIHFHFSIILSTT